MKTLNPIAPHDHGSAHPTSNAQLSVEPSQVGKAAPRGSARRKIFIGSLAVVILVSLAALGGYLSGARAHDVSDPAGPGGMKTANGGKDNKDKSGGEKGSPLPGVSLVKDLPHTVRVPEEVRKSLGIRKGDQDVIYIAQPPAEMAPLVLPGSTALDPIRLARIRARFAPARVVQIGKVQDYSGQGKSEYRELRPGDRVEKGDVLGIFYSVDVGSKKNDLLDALTQLEQDQKVLDNAEKHIDSVPEVFMIYAIRQVQTDRNQVDRALHNLEAWDIPQDEIDGLREEAKKQAADKSAWKKTREGAWATGGEPKPEEKIDPDSLAKNPWGKVTLRAPFDGVIVERNVHIDEMVVDNTVNLFQIAQVNKLLVIANCPEDQLPIVESLGSANRHWTIRTAGIDTTAGLPGTIDEIGYLIDPNQHTAIIKGYVENPGQHLRAGQYISATIPILPPPGVVEIPLTALMDDGQQSLVFVQPDPKKAEYTMRRVKVMNRFDHKAFISSTYIPKEEQLTAQEAEEGCLPKEPLRPGERVLQTGTGELHMAILTLETEALKDSHESR
jgi:cobalt-zinc-cadmium efflux system membrane fusion protein